MVESEMYAARNRARKAARLALAARAMGITTEAVATDEQARGRLVKATEVTFPSKEAWAMTIGILEVLSDQESAVPPTVRVEGSEARSRRVLH